MHPSVEVSVVLCTHNPRPDYLARVMAALQRQTLPAAHWELLLIDNASATPQPLMDQISWHPHGRYILEPQLGLTPARLRGIAEAQADLLIFVDDDNVLDDDYLEVARQISCDKPWIGAWGGQIRPEFEQPPPAWTRPYWGMLAIREFDSDRWANLPDDHRTIPCGAGLCVRRSVATLYAERVHIDHIRLALDRRGAQLSSAGDTDLALTACDIGLGTGQFAALGMTHLIPASRLEEAYLLRLAEGLSYSTSILNSIRGGAPPRATWRYWVYRQIQRLFTHPREVQFIAATDRGAALAQRHLAQVKSVFQ